MTTLKRNDLIYPELCYKIMGSLFNVQNNIGFGHKEKFYQEALGEEFSHVDIKFQRELPAKIAYRGKIIGMYYFDFLVDAKVVLELKVRNYFSQKDIQQLYSYLKAKNLKLGIIAHFTKSGVKFKRVVNVV